MTHLSLALSLDERSGDAASQAHTRRALARAWEEQGDWQQALGHITTALRLFQTLNLPHWEADALTVAGWEHAHLGQHVQARAALHAALELHLKHNDRHGQANTEDSLGYTALHVGDHDQAVHHYTQALTLWRGLGHSHGEADALAGLATAYTALGDQPNATRTGHHALALFRDQHRPAEAARLERDCQGLIREPVSDPG